jgi:hypothetical protein
MLLIAPPPVPAASVHRRGELADIDCSTLDITGWAAWSAWAPCAWEPARDITVRRGWEYAAWGG